mmetsp:Transcript_10263/g.19401  ORF Transcript_10263/g.19401 Transcript_10263/m.19401 type:complete len:312 (+) Transcript_10263:631-1566(+)
MDCLTSLYGGFLPQGLGLRRRPDEKYGVTKMPPIREEHEDEDTYVKFLGPDIAGTPLFTEFCAVLMVSMSGSLRSAPEPILDWVFNESDREGRNFHFLDGRPNQKRKIFFKFILTWIATHAMSHGACYALIDPVTNAIVAAAACFPPNDDNSHEMGTFTWMSMVWSLCMTGSLAFPEDLSSNTRLSAVEETSRRLHAAHAPTRHWYLKAIAVAPSLQGKGYGTKLLRHITALADEARVPVYADTAGPRLQRFLSQNGLEVVERAAVVDGKDTFDAHGGMISMLRRPRQGSHEEAVKVVTRSTQEDTANEAT